jgi:hypothetical protein
VRLLQLLEHQHGEPREPQLAGQEETDRGRACDDHVVDQGVFSARVSCVGVGYFGVRLMTVLASCRPKVIQYTLVESTTICVTPCDIDRRLLLP